MTLSPELLFPKLVPKENSPESLIFQFNQDDSFRKELQGTNQKDAVFDTDRRLEQIRLKKQQGHLSLNSDAMIMSGWPCR